jgi:hypothetical protein
MRRIKALILGLALALGSSSAMADCNGQPAAGLFCGNPTGAAAIPTWATGSAMLDRAFGGPSLQGTILNRGASLWSSTSSPSLGLTGTATGSMTFFGLTSGSSILTVPAVAGTGSRFQLPATNGINGQTLITDGSGNTSWASSGAGTVTSVGLALPASILTVSGSPVTNTGTLTGTLATQSANLVWAGPNTGAAAAPTFRSLVGADLPNPSASTLGGIQSFAAVGSQWIRQISTSGVPTASQPAFTDISGTLAASQCPNPSASTIGCVQSLAAVTSKWINAISTSGVPSATQPVFSDIGGNSSLSQLPSIGNNTILSNIAGGSATPLANSLSSFIDSAIASTQGDVLYRNGSVWTALAPGTNGQVLTTGGAAANVSWTTVTGTGTVTSIATNNGITGGTITTTGTIGLSTIATGNVLGNFSGISAAPTATTPSTVIDGIGSTEGSVLYRGASTWLALTPGTNGQFLQTNGAGSTPQWASPITAGNNITYAGGVVSAASYSPGGRLTLASHTPVMAASQAAATTLYYDSYASGSVPYWTGTLDTIDTITSNEVSTSMQSSSTGVLNATGVFDVWWEGNTNHNICVATNGSGGGWASDTAGSNTTRGTGYSQLDSTTRPYITNKNSVAHCYNGATDYGSITANKLTYLGTISTGSAGQVNYIFGAAASPGTAANFGVFNAYNRVNVSTTVSDTTATWSYTSSTVRPSDNSTTNRVTFVSGLPQEGVVVSFDQRVAGTGSETIGFGLDSITIFDKKGVNNATNNSITPTASYLPQTGLHFIQALEAGDNVNAGTYVGGATEYSFNVQLRM